MMFQLAVPHWRRALYCRLRECLLEAGYDLSLVYSFGARTIANHQGEGGVPGVTCIDRRLRRVFGLAEYLSDIIPLIYQHRPEVVITDASPRFLTAWQLARLRSKLNYLLIGWSSGYFRTKDTLHTAIRQAFFRGFDGIMTYTHEATRILKRDHGLSRVKTIGNAIDETQIEREAGSLAAEDITNLRQRLLGQCKLLVLFVGKLARGKRVELLLETALQAPQYKFIIIGDGPKGPTLRQEADAIPNVEFLGQIVDGVNAYFRAADVFVLPGAGGLALVQALHNSLPIISSAADGIGYETVKNHYNGYISDHLNVAFLLRSLRNMEDCGTRARFGANSYALSREFMSSKVVGNVVDFVSELDSKRP